MDVYGREAYEFRENSIVASIPYERLDTAWISSRKSAIENEKPDFEGEKLAIEGEKTSSGHQKVAIERIYELCREQNYNRPIMENILKVYENTDVDAVASTPDIERITQCSASTSKNIIKKLKKINVLVAVSGGVKASTDSNATMKNKDFQEGKQ